MQKKTKKEITDELVDATPAPVASVGKYTVDIKLLSDEHELNKPQIWHRQPGEPVTAYQYFKAYLRMGEGVSKMRSLKRVGKHLRLSESYIYQLSFTYDWQERAAAYDLYWLEFENEARKAASQANEKKWAERTEKLKEQEWQMAQALMKKVEFMLSIPLVREVVMSETTELADDGTTTIIKKIINHEPVDWSLADMTRMMELFSKLGRLSSGQDTDRKKVKINFGELST